MNFDELRWAADTAMGEALTSAGFRRSAAGTWNRRKEEDLNVIWFQKHSASSSFCVNLGVHYSFMPKAGSMELPEGDSIAQPECAITMRLTLANSVNDQWWPLAKTSITEVCKLIEFRGLAIFDSYRLHGPLAAIEVSDIEVGTPNLLSSLTEVGACLLLARVHEHAGNREKCIEAATAGLKLAGFAVGPKKALREILKRLEQSA